MDYKEMLEKAAGLFEGARVILAKPDATDEERSHIPEMLADARRLKADAITHKEILDAADDLGKMLSDKATSVQPKGSGTFGTFKSWGEFLQAVYMAGHPSVKSPADPRLQFFKDKDEEAVMSVKSLDKKDMAEAVGASGGFLVPVEQQNTLYNVMGESSIVRGRATRIPMARRQILLPVLDQTGTTQGVPHWFGGLQFYWAEEAAEKTESDAKFRQVALVAHKLIGYTRASDELVDDSAISLDAFLSGPLGFAGGVTWMEDFTFLRGTGAGQPQGVITAPATLVVPRQAQNAVGWIDLVNMFEDLLPSSSAAWFISQSVISNLMTMQDPSGQYMWPTLFQGGASTGRPTSLLGLSVQFTEKLPRIGTQGDVLLADWRYYLIGDRQATTVESTKYDRWKFDQTSWRVVHRVDGRPWLSAPLTYEDGVTQVSPFVVLGNKTT